MLTKEQNELITRVGPGTPGGAFFRRFWIPALLAEELPAPDCQPVRVRLLNEDLVAYRDSEGKVGLLTESCPHRRASLWYGRNEEGGLRCVYHGWKFNREGHCVDMPNEPAESNFKNKVHITAYPVEERGGVIWAYMGPKELQPELPEMEWALAPDSHRYITKLQVDCNYLQSMEADIDNSHVSFLHQTLDASAVLKTMSSDVMKQDYSPILDPDHAPRGIVKEMDYGIMMGWRRAEGAGQYYWHINHWMMPSYVLIGAQAGRPPLCNIRIPMDDEHTWFFRVRWNTERPFTATELDDFRSGGILYAEKIPGTWRPVRNKDNDYGIDRSLQRGYSYTGIKGINEQDLAMMESMGPIVDRSREHLGTSDVVIIAVRRRLQKLISGLQQGVEPLAAGRGAAYRYRPVDVLLKRGVPFDEGAKGLMTLHMK